MRKPNGGPAFPLPGGSYQVDSEGRELSYSTFIPAGGGPSTVVTPAKSGMTLRDYFAAQALSAVPAYLQELQTDQRIKIAEWAYGVADAMLGERDK